MRATLWIIVAALVLLFVILFRAGVQPVRVVIINQSGHDAHEVVVSSVAIGALANGESRVVSATSGEPLVITFREQKRRWQSAEPLAPAGGYVFAITPGDRIAQQSRRMRDRQ